MDVNLCLLIWSFIKIISKKYLGVKLMFDTSIELSNVNSIRNERFFYLTQYDSNVKYKI
jgi:hypothetical protein